LFLPLEQLTAEDLSGRVDEVSGTPSNRERVMEMKAAIADDGWLGDGYRID
jgi:hypothetical protein